CVLAGLRPWLLAQSATRPLRSGWIFAGAFATMTAIELVGTRPSVMPTWAFNLVLVTIQNAMIALVIHWSIANHASAIGRMLNSRPLTAVGVVSYSLYIWQQPFLNPYVSATWTRFPLSMLAVAACAVISYRWIEQPSLAWRKKMDGRFGARGDHTGVSRTPA